MAGLNPIDKNHGEREQSGGEPGVHKEGFYLDDLPDGAVLDVATEHHHYTVVKKAHSLARISGHPKFCPEPVTVAIDGSLEGQSDLKPGYIGCGLHMVFEHPVYHTVTTSPILAVRKVA
jgi:hypothetical protein